MIIDVSVTLSPAIRNVAQRKKLTVAKCES